MTVADHKPPTIDPTVESLISFDPKTGKASGHLVELLRQLRDYNLGGSRIVPCDCAGTNTLTLTPANPVSPIMESYADHDIFSFVAAETSTSSMVASVISRDGASMGSRKMYKTNGSTQAGSGDVVQARHYQATYVSTLDSGNGGFVVR